MVIFVGECEKYALKDSNIRTFECSEEINKLVDPTAIAGLKVVWYHYCDAMLGHHNNMNEAKTADLIIGDAMYLCSFLVADKFSLPHVTVLMSPLSTALRLPYNFADLPSYIPQMFSGLTDDMNFLQRAGNSLRWFLGRLSSPNALHSVYGGLKEKYNITPEKTLQQTFQKVDIVLVQSDPLDYPRPHLPSKCHVRLFSLHRNMFSYSSPQKAYTSPKFEFISKCLRNESEREKWRGKGINFSQFDVGLSLSRGEGWGKHYMKRTGKLGVPFRDSKGVLVPLRVSSLEMSTAEAFVVLLGVQSRKKHMTGGYVLF